VPREHRRHRPRRHAAGLPRRRGAEAGPGEGRAAVPLRRGLPADVGEGRGRRRQRPAVNPGCGFGRIQEFMLPKPTLNADIQEVRIIWNGGSGITGDNWDLQSLSVYAWSPPEGLVYMGGAVGTPLRRFTSSVLQYVWNWVP